MTPKLISVFATENIYTTKSFKSPGLILQFQLDWRMERTTKKFAVAGGLSCPPVHVAPVSLDRLKKYPTDGSKSYHIIFHCLRDGKKNMKHKHISSLKPATEMAPHFFFPCSVVCVIARVTVLVFPFFLANYPDFSVYCSLSISRTSHHLPVS